MKSIQLPEPESNCKVSRISDEMRSWELSKKTIGATMTKRLYRKPEEGVLALCDTGLPIPLPRYLPASWIYRLLPE
jgi:hypothetical protein